MAIILVLLLLYILGDLAACLLSGRLSLGDFFDILLHPITYLIRKGSGTERYLYRELRKAGVPKRQIFRNVYVPKYDRKYAEIDVLVISKKGFLVFECKDYSGKIYGDGKKATWTKYLGGRKYPFLNPIIQNAGHIKYLLKYFRRFGYYRAASFIVPSVAGEWNLKNIRKDVYFLQRKGDFMRAYRKLPDCPEVAIKFETIISELKKMEKMSYVGRKRHVREIKRTQKIKRRR